MTDNKQLELKKYRDLVIATLDYNIDNKKMAIKTADFDSTKYYQELKIQSEEDFLKGRLTKLKQYFRDLTDIYIETVDLNFNNFLKDRTKHEIDIFKSYFQRVHKIIERGKISSDNQFYDINMMIDYLCQSEPVDNNQIEILNRLLSEYKHRKF